MRSYRRPLVRGHLRNISGIGIGVNAGGGETFSITQGVMNMAFVDAPGIKGQMYVPEASRDCVKKRECPDCVSCQICNDDKCEVCLNQAIDDTEAAAFQTRSRPRRHP